MFLLLVIAFQPVKFAYADFDISTKDNHEKFWESTFIFGGGLSKSAYNGEINKLGRIGTQFYLWPNIENKDIEFGVEIETQSPLHENDSFIQIPLNGRDFIQISKLYLNHKILPQFQYTLGMFPDVQEESVPKVWPYYSIQMRLDFIISEDFSALILARHDVFKTYAAEEYSSKATQITRSMIQTQLQYSNRLRLRKINSSIKGSYIDFDDPDNALRSLSLGRNQYIDYSVASKNIRYKNLDLSTVFSFNFLQEFSLFAKYWHNLEVTDLSNGILFGGKIENSFSSSWMTSIAFWRCFAQQYSIPPSAISVDYYPGFDIMALESTISYIYSKMLKFNLESRIQAFKVYGQDSNLNTPGPGVNPVIPKAKILFTMEYKLWGS